MKQKLVVKVCMHGPKCRSKALKIVVGFPGIISVNLIGPDKDQIEVIGDDIDVIKIVKSLRKVGSVQVVSVAKVEEKKKEEEEKKKKEEEEKKKKEQEKKKKEEEEKKKAHNWLPCPGTSMPQYFYVVDDPPLCSIL